MKKIIQLLLILALVCLVSCTSKSSGCPYMKMKGKCEAGCTESCQKAKEMKGDYTKSCGAKSCGMAEGKSCSK